jgi:hypothetical protein
VDRFDKYHFSGATELTRDRQNTAIAYSGLVNDTMRLPPYLGKLSVQELQWKSQEQAP